MRPKTPFRVGRALRLDKNLLRGSVRIVSNFRMLHKGVNSENVFQTWSFHLADCFDSIPALHFAENFAALPA